jgi:hypothetical protein
MVRERLNHQGTKDTKKKGEPPRRQGAKRWMRGRVSAPTERTVGSSALEGDCARHAFAWRARKRDAETQAQSSIWHGHRAASSWRLGVLAISPLWLP